MIYKTTKEIMILTRNTRSSVTIPKLEEEIKLLEEKMKENIDTALLKEEVTENEISQIVAKWTGIPVTKLAETEKEKLLKLEEELQKRVIGQEEAVNAVSNAIIRARAGLKDENKPIGFFYILRANWCWKN